MADSAGVHGERRVRVVEFRSSKDYQRWLATWGNRIEVVSTAASDRRYTVTYKGQDTTATTGKRPRNPFVKLLQIGAALLVGGFLLLAVIGNLDPTIDNTRGFGSPSPRPTDLPIAGAVVLTPDQFILPAEQFPLPGYTVTADQAVGAGSWTRTWTTSGGTAFYWVRIDATVLKPSVTSNDAIAKTTCDWTFTTPMLKAAEITAPVVGDGAKACAYDSANSPASTIVYTAGTRNTLVTVSANRLAASPSATTGFLASLADYQLWTIDRVAPAPGLVARAAPEVQIPTSATSGGSSNSGGGGTASGGGTALAGGAAGSLPPIESNLPAGFPTNLPSAAYDLKGCILAPGGFASFSMTWDHCNNYQGNPITIASGQGGPLAQAINKADLCTAGCITSYTIFNGSFFDVLHKRTDCSSSGGNPALCGVSYVLLRVTRR